MSTRCFVFLSVLVVIFAEFPLSSCFQWINFPATDYKLTLPTSQKSVRWRWEWRLGSGEAINQTAIRRYKSLDQVNTVKDIAFLRSDNKATIPNEFKSFFTIESQIGSAGSNGYMELTIIDVTNQGNNKDNTPANVMSTNYTYECKVNIRDESVQPNSKATKLIVYVMPAVRTAPQDRLVTTKRTDITLKCIADGQPKPTITWTRESVFAGQSSFNGESLAISKSTGDDDFQISDIGTYICTATNEVGSVSATAVLQYIECSTGCSTVDKIAIEMTQLTYHSDYGNGNSDKYKQLKHGIEKECFTVYARATQKVYSCIVTGFRSGSVVADIRITYPNNTNQPQKPLKDALKTGTFAGHKVRTVYFGFTRPIIRTPPQDRFVTDRKADIALKCVANGNPHPTITWTRKSMFAGQSAFVGEDLVISKSTGDDDFQNSDIGTYNCTATNEVGSISAAAIVQYTECSTGCSTDDKIAVEMTDLKYGSDYGYENSYKYRVLKEAIEKECFAVYARATQKVYSCTVTGFRSGSVIAIIKITYPSNTKEPRQPLETAIKSGTFAGHKVKGNFVSHKASLASIIRPLISPGHSSFVMMFFQVIMIHFVCSV